MRACIAERSSASLCDFDDSPSAQARNSQVQPLVVGSRTICTDDALLANCWAGAASWRWAFSGSPVKVSLEVAAPVTPAGRPIDVDAGPELEGLGGGVIATVVETFAAGGAPSSTGAPGRGGRGDWLCWPPDGPGEPAWVGASLAPPGAVDVGGPIGFGGDAIGGRATACRDTAATGAAAGLATGAGGGGGLGAGGGAFAGAGAGLGAGGFAGAAAAALP